MKKSLKPILIVIGLTILIGNVYSDSPKKVKVTLVNKCNKKVGVRVKEEPDPALGGKYRVIDLRRNGTIEFDDVEAGQDFYLAVSDGETFQKYLIKKTYKRKIRCDTLVVLRYDDERGYEWLEFEFEDPTYLEEKKQGEKQGGKQGGNDTAADRDNLR